MPNAANEPAINLPPLTLALIVANVAIFGGLRLFDSGVAWTAIDQFGFTPARFSAAATPGLSGWLSPLSYLFLHGDWVHLAVNMVTLAAFGAGIERRAGALTMLSFYLLSGALAAGAHYAVYPTSDDPVIGASGAISGLVGGILYLMRGSGRQGWLLGVAIVWSIPTVLFGFLGMPGTNGAGIAWVAHLGGFFGGLALGAILLSGSDRTA